MNVKAEAYQEWNQAAVVDKLITGLPEVAQGAGRAAAEHRQDHDCFDRRRRRRRHEQDHRRHGEDGGADSRVVRDAFRHADVGTVWQSAHDWR